MNKNKAAKPIEKPPGDVEKRVRRPGRQVFDWSRYEPSMSSASGSALLVEELVTYRDRLPELLGNQGNYVLIRGPEVFGIYECRDEAIRQAIQRFRDAPVLVKQIVAKEPVLDLGGAAL